MSFSADYQEELTQSTEIMYIDLHSFCQTQPQLNFNFEVEIALFSDNTATHPTNHPTGKVVKWNKTSSTSIEDFKYIK